MKTMIKSLLALAMLLILSISACVKEQNYPDMPGEKISVSLSLKDVFNETVISPITNSDARTSALSDGFEHVLSNREVYITINQKDMISGNNQVITETSHFNTLHSHKITLIIGYQYMISIGPKEQPVGNIDGLEFYGSSDIFVAEEGMDLIQVAWKTDQVLITVRKEFLDPEITPEISLFSSCQVIDDVTKSISFGDYERTIVLNDHLDWYAIYVNDLSKGYELTYTKSSGNTHSSKYCSLAGGYRYNVIPNQEGNSLIIINLDDLFYEVQING